MAVSEIVHYVTESTLPREKMTKRMNNEENTHCFQKLVEIVFVGIDRLVGDEVTSVLRL